MTENSFEKNVQLITELASEGKLWDYLSENFLGVDAVVDLFYNLKRFSFEFHDCRYSSELRTLNQIKDSEVINSYVFPDDTILNLENDFFNGFIAQIARKKTIKAKPGLKLDFEYSEGEPVPDPAILVTEMKKYKSMLEAIDRGDLFYCFEHNEVFYNGHCCPKCRKLKGKEWLEKYFDQYDYFDPYATVLFLFGVEIGVYSGVVDLIPFNGCVFNCKTRTLNYRSEFGIQVNCENKKIEELCKEILYNVEMGDPYNEQ